VIGRGEVAVGAGVVLVPEGSCLEISFFVKSSYMVFSSFARHATKHTRSATEHGTNRSLLLAKSHNPLFLEVREMVDVRQFCSEMLKRQDFIFTTHSPNLPWRNDSVTPEMCFIPNRISVCRNAFRDLKSPNISRSSKMHSRPIINTKCILGRSRHLVRSQMDFYFAPPRLMDFVSNKMHFVVSKSSILLDFMLLLLMQRYD
jgi:hypothetical protein